MFLSADDFFEKASACQRLTREQELQYAEAMRGGDAEAKEALLQGYLPHVAAHLKRSSALPVSLELIYRCVASLEKAVETFDFTQTGETFAHRLSWHLRQEATRYIANCR